MQRYSFKGEFITNTFGAYFVSYSPILQIYNGAEAIEEKSILKWCNSTTPGATQYETNGNKALVKFTSGGLSAKGFKIRFETNCGYDIVTNGAGMINLHDSGPFKKCEWNVASNIPSGRITLTVNHFSSNASNFRDLLTVIPSIERDDIQPNTFFATGSALKVILIVNGPTVFQASYNANDNCKSIQILIDWKRPIDLIPFQFVEVNSTHYKVL